jgi:DUF1009 family protein
MADPAETGGPLKAVTAIVAGAGALPLTLAGVLRAAGAPFVLAGVEGFAPEGSDVMFRLERLMPFLDTLHDRGVARVAFAGALHRPRLDPAMFDPRTAALAPRFVAAMQGGDDATLREVIALFEENGLEVVGAADLAPDLLPGPGVLGRVAPDRVAESDAARAAGIVAALGAVDVGQAAVVARGVCLGVEAIAGTDALLDMVAGLPGHLRARGRAGLLYKAAKPMQDRRIDLPALGPGTVARAHGAGLAGVAFQPGGVMVLDLEATVARADDLGLFLWAWAP